MHFRKENDEEGDTAIGLVILLHTSHAAQQVMDALIQEGVSNAYRMYNEHVVDNHIKC